MVTWVFEVLRFDEAFWVYTHYLPNYYAFIANLHAKGGEKGGENPRSTIHRVGAACLHHP
jgi:hypothetical protein